MLLYLRPAKLTFLFALFIVFVGVFVGAGATACAWAQQSPSTASSADPKQASPAASGQAKPETDSKPPLTEPDEKKPDDKKPVVVPGVDPKTGTPLYETIQEDWSSLAVGVSKLEPEPPLAADPEDHEGFTRTLVQVKWRPGDPLDLFIILPKGVKKPPAVLYLYGYKDDTERFRDDQWCQHVTSGGTAAIGFISALSTSRFHDRPLAQWFVSELQESLGSTVHDVKFILDYLAERGDIDMNRIGMFGQSSGGAITLLAAAADPRIKAVDVLDPWGDWPVWLAKSPVALDDPNAKDYLKPEFLKKVEPLDPVKWLPSLKATQVRIQQVKNNPATPDACKDALRDAAPKNAEVVRFDSLSDLSKAAGQGQLFDWIKAKLKDLPTSFQQPTGALTTQVSSQADKQEPKSEAH